MCVWVRESGTQTGMGVAWVCIAYMLGWEPISRGVLNVVLARWSVYQCGYMLDCAPKAYKTCRCPASGPKEKSGKSHRDISGLVDQSKTKGPGATPHSVQQMAGRTW